MFSKMSEINCHCVIYRVCSSNKIYCFNYLNNEFLQFACLNIGIFQVVSINRIKQKLYNTYILNTFYCIKD